MITQTWCWAYISKTITKFCTFPSQPPPPVRTLGPLPTHSPIAGPGWWIQVSGVPGVPRVSGTATDLPRKLGSIHAKTLLKPNICSKFCFQGLWSIKEWGVTRSPACPFCTQRNILTWNNHKKIYTDLRIFLKLSNFLKATFFGR